MSIISYVIISYAISIHIHTYIKVGNCCIQRTEPSKQKKRNRIKMPTPVEVCAS